MEITVPLGVGAVVPLGDALEGAKPGTDESEGVGQLFIGGKEVVGGEGKNAVEGSGDVWEVEAGFSTTAASNVYSMGFPIDVGVRTDALHHGD